MTLGRLLGSATLFIAFNAGAVIVAAGPPAAPRDVQLTGVTKDQVGATLERVLVFLTPIGPAESVRSAVTDRDGRFAFPNVPFATYRITAFKDGYQSTVGQVTTWMQDRLDLVLVPTAQRVPAPDPTWILKTPRRDILRDLDAVSVLGENRTDALPTYAADQQATSNVSAPEFLESLDGEVRQFFSETQRANSSDVEVTGGKGTSTSVLLGSAIGSRARWDILGQRDRENTSWRNADFEARQSNGDRLRVNLRYDTGRESRLDMRAYYDYDSLAFEPLAGAPILDVDRERRAWGYDAGWVGGVGGDSSLQVDLRYLGSSLYGGGNGGRGDRNPGKSEILADKIESGTNIWRTGARLSKKVGTDHQVHVGVNARLYSFEGPERSAPSATQDPNMFTALGRDGWTVSVNAAESWNILDPLALDFGFDVSRSVYSASRLRQAVIPQAGMTFTPTSATTVRGVVSYVAVEKDVSTSNTPDDLDDRRHGDSIGYKLRIERTVGQRWLVMLDAESRPFFYDSIGAQWEAPDAIESGHNLYLTDAGASLKEVDLSFEARPVPGTLLRFGASSGRVEGSVAPSVPEDDLSQSLTDGTVQYVVAHANGSFEATGTDVRIELTRLNQGLSTGTDPYGDRRIAVRLLQSLAFLHPGDTSWALLLNYSSYVPLATDPGSSKSAPTVRAALNRISGGVSVKF